MLTSNLGLSKAYLALWRKKFFRDTLNFRRRILLDFLKGGIPVASTEIANRVSDELAMHGIAKAHISEFPGMPPLSQLQQEYEDLLGKSDSKQLDRGSKAFIERLVDDDYPIDDRSTAISEYILNEGVAHAAALYLGLVPKLSSFKIWRSHQDSSTERLASQNWLRDYNEYQMVRVLLYFNDVDKNNGAGEYVIGSHYRGDSFEILQESENGISRYATQEAVNMAFESEKVTIARGRAGTLYFMDTGGLHRGGFHPVPGERRVALTTFSTAADLMPTMVRRPKHLSLTKFMRRVLA